MPPIDRRPPRRCSKPKPEAPTDYFFFAAGLRFAAVFFAGAFFAADFVLVFVAFFAMLPS